MISSKSKIAIYAGSFDPITFGHLDIAKRSSIIFDHVILGIAESKAKNPLFSLKERSEIAHYELKNNQLHHSISVRLFTGLLVDFAKSQNASVIIRGLRAVSDFEYEFKMAYMNYKLNSTIETVFLSSNETSHFISSSFVKEIAKLGGDINSFVSSYVAHKIKMKFEKRRKIVAYD